MSRNNLYHSNTVRTSCSFLSQGKLLARGSIEKLGLPQTEQPSDLNDKKFGLWFDVFMDGVDIHDRAKKRNQYGPVLFYLNLSILEHDWRTYSGLLLGSGWPGKSFADYAARFLNYCL